jgi:glycosyltransferase involved in cell wall biosynthesis
MEWEQSCLVTGARTIMLSPLPTGRGERQGGVAAYTSALLRALPSGTHVVALAQRSAQPGSLGPAQVVPTWTPDTRAVAQVWRAIRHWSADLVHFQHEFNLYGGVLPTSLLTAGLAASRGTGLPIITTIHGVIDPADINDALLRRNGLPGPPSLVRLAFRTSYRLISAASEAVVVHHEHFGELLAVDYGVPRAKVQTVPMGSEPPPASVNGRAGGRRVLVLGFLTGYKLPELVADVAESGSFRGGFFRFCVGSHPTVDTPQYRERYRRLQERVQKLSDRAEWLGYVPDEQLHSAFADVDILVLPYTECISVSGVAALAETAGLSICYSRALRPLFGPGPLEFELSEMALTASLERAADEALGERRAIFAPWPEAAAATEHLWRTIVGREE